MTRFPGPAMMRAQIPQVRQREEYGGCRPYRGSMATASFRSRKTCLSLVPESSTYSSRVNSCATGVHEVN